MPAVKKSQLYWYCQFFGWSFYIVVNSIFFGLSSESGFREYLVYLLMLPVGIIISHLYRLLLHRFGLIGWKIPSQLLFIVFSSFVKGVLFFMVILMLSTLFGFQLAELTLIDVSESVINFAVIFFVWNMIYFGFQYFQNYRRSEINALRYLAASRESELNNLKAQLNPHFIFNCMNSIRALIDEHPANAKLAVTRLSNILRNTLLLDKSKEIPLKDEMRLVQDYLDLEQIRYEERLRYEFRIAPEAAAVLIPPFLVQAQVENAIKHGISVLPGGGTITVEALVEGEELRIMVSNTGHLGVAAPLTGVGFRNSRQRLELLYGHAAGISIREESGLVRVDIRIPLVHSEEKPAVKAAGF